MSDLISRQDAIDVVTKILDDYKSRGRYDKVGALMAVDANIKALPSAQPEIIRCKDCFYFRKPVGDNNYCDHDFAGIRHVPFEDDYCSYAERREDGES